MFDYNLFDKINEKVYNDTVTLIEKEFPYYYKERELIDVDSTRIQVFSKDGKSVIKVFNDTNIGAVYINSEIDLSDYFS